MILPLDLVVPARDTLGVMRLALFVGLLSLASCVWCAFEDED